MAARSKKPPARTPELDAATRILVLHGKERFFQLAYTDRLKQNIEQTGESVDVHLFDGDQAELADVLDECRSFGLIGGHKIVILDHADKLVQKDNRPLVERYAEAPTDGCTLVLRTETWRKGNLDKLIERHGGLIKCDTPDPGTAAGWVRNRVTKHLGVEIDDRAAIALVERVGCELDRLAVETDKLAVAVNAGEPITLATIDAVVGKTREEEVWDIQRRLLTGDAEGAVAYLRDLVSTSRQPPTLIRWAIVDLVRKLHALSRAAATGGDLGAAGKALKLWGPSAEPTRRAGAALRPDAAGALLRRAIDTDVAAKTGLGDELLALETLSLRVIDAVHSQARVR